MRVHPEVVYAALLSDLQQHIDVSAPKPDVDSTPREVACYLLRDSLLKKFNEADDPSEQACDAAMEKFLAVNDRCASWEIPFEVYPDEELINGVRHELHNFWFRGRDAVSPLVEDLRELFYRGGPGPGASLMARGNDFYTKYFDSSLTATGDLHFVWNRCTSKLAEWHAANATRYRDHGDTVVESSNYSFVNKTTTVARGICTEPSVNMWLQKGLGNILDSRLASRFGVNIRGKGDSLAASINRLLAQRGSSDGCFATIDLESASDSLSISTLRQIAPKSLFDLVNLLRCSKTRLPDGKVLKLNMVSTMGNGFTFSLMTALFCCVVKSVYRFLGIPFHSGHAGATFGVFGDDIIVKTEAAKLVLRVIHLLGYVPNTEKTFVEGRFRESCGADCYEGVDIRGVYIKRLKSQQNLFSSINTLNRWSAKTGVPLVETVGALLRGVRHPQRWYVPFDEDDASGIKVPECLVRGLENNRCKGGLRSYSSKVPEPDKFWIVGGHCWTYKHQKARSYNPPGLLTAFLGGYIRGYSVTLRQRVTKYITKRRRTPCWDYLPRELRFGLSQAEARTRVVDVYTRNLLGSGE